jgi:hypothetical protein
VTRTLAEIALEEGLTDRRTLDRAARHADEHDLPLVVALVRASGVDEVVLFAALRKQTRVAAVEPGAVTPDSDALREVPREVCERRRVFPLGLRLYGAGPRVLQLAMADPTDAVAIAEVEHLTGCRVDPALMTLSTIEELTARGYGGFVTKVMRRERPPAEAAARAVGALHDVAVDGVPALGAAPSPAGPPVTAPFHRVADEADVRAQLEALVQLLVDKGVLERAELDEAVRQLLRRRADEG